MKKDMIFTAAVRFIIVLLGFLATVVTARYLGPEGRGDYFFITTLAAMVAQFSNLGLQSSNTYLVAKDENLFGRLLANSFWVSLILGAGSATVIALFLRATHCASDPVYGTYVRYTVLLAPAMLFFLLGSNLLVGINKIAGFNLFQVFGSGLTLVFFIAAAFCKWSVQGFLLSSTAAWSLTSVLLFIALYRYSSSSMAFDRSAFKLGSRYASKAYLATLLGFLVLRSNVFLLKSFTDATQLGFFSVASQMADVLGILPASTALVLFPNLVKHAEQRWDLTIKNMLLVSLLMLAGCLTAAVLFKPFIRIAFGERFLPAVPVFYCMLPGVLAMAAATILSQYLAAVGFPKMLVSIWLIDFAVVSLMGYILIPTHACIGAAISYSVAYVVLLVMVLALSLKLESERKLSTLKYAPA